MQHFDDANFEQAHTNSPPPPPNLSLDPPLVLDEVHQARQVVDGASGTLWGSVHDRSWTEYARLHPRPVMDGVHQTPSTTAVVDGA